VAFDPEAIRAFEHARWQEAAPVYGTTFANATKPFIAPLLDAAAVAQGMRVLDICCGPGFVVSTAVARGAVVHGLDFSSAMLAVAMSREPAATFDAGDAESLPYADATFDSVVANFGIHHVPRPQLALSEAHRVLRPGGRVAFSFWAEPSDNIAWKLVFDAVARYGDRAAARTPAPGGGFGTPAQCAEALRDAGFCECITEQVCAIWSHPDAAHWSQRCGRAPRAWRRCSKPSTLTHCLRSPPMSLGTLSVIAMVGSLACPLPL
jgi:SAM-dependent methyltransferase